MQIDYWAFLYENWLVFFGTMLTLIIILTSIVVRIVVTRIQDKVLYFQKNSIDEFKAKLKKGYLSFGKKHKVKKVKDAYMMKKGFRLIRMYIVDWKRKETIDFRDLTPTAETDRIMWETIIESEAITQTIKGLLETTRMILMYMGAGAGIGFLISQVLFTMG